MCAWALSFLTTDFIINHSLECLFASRVRLIEVTPEFSLPFSKPLTQLHSIKYESRVKGGTYILCAHSFNKKRFSIYLRRLLQKQCKTVNCVGARDTLVPCVRRTTTWKLYVAAFSLVTYLYRMPRKPIWWRIVAIIRCLISLLKCARACDQRNKLYFAPCFVFHAY